MDWINASTKLYGVVGHNISYTLSPAIHNYVFRKTGYNAVYLVFDIPRDKFSAVFRGLLEICEGLNITIPYKEEALGFLNEVDTVVKAIGAVNTVYRGRGYNTDYIAIKTLVKNTIGDLSNELCYVYGAGGAARAVTFALGELGCKVVVVNRTRERAEKLVQDLRNFGINASIASSCESRSAVVVNATPVPSIVPDSCLDTELVLELVYKPVETDLVKRAKARNLKVINGITVLIKQALEAQKIWSKAHIPEEEVIGYLYARKLVW